MFSDETLDGVEYFSSWKKERSLKDSKTQTSEISTSDVEVQSLQRIDVEVQTESEGHKRIVMAMDDSQALTDFLLNVEPIMSSQLERNNRSHAFDGYDLDEFNDEHSVTNLHKLSHDAFNGEMPCTNLAWSKSGSTIAVSYGRMDHEDWCTHKGALCTWNLDRRNINVTKADTVIDTNSCLMCIAYHPDKPAIIAGGKFNGEVCIWDLNREDDALIFTSGIGDDSHREPVTQVLWSQDPDRPKRYNLVSVSGDGKVLVWKRNKKKGSLELLQGFLLLASSMPATSGVRERKGEMGVSCISYVQEDRNQFVVGSESGGLFKCSMNSTTTVPTSEVMSSVPLFSPVIFAFAPHHGPVHSVECSPYHRNLFLSCGTDTSARVYSMLESRSIISVEPSSGYLFAAQWSPVRPLVFALTTGDGKLLIYDLKSSKITPVQTLQASPTKQVVYTLQFNANQRQQLATGDATGTIMVWQLPDDLTIQGAREVETLADLANAGAE